MSQLHGPRPDEWLESRSKILAGVDPFEYLTDEVKNSYLRCSYKWSFHHIPNLLIGMREKSLDPLLIWAMLAITVRYVPSTCRANSTKYAADSIQIFSSSPTGLL